MSFSLDQVVNHVRNDPRTRSIITGIATQTAYAAGGTVVGGVVGGPIGALAGGAVGAVVGYARTDNYASCLRLVMELDDEQKHTLVQTIVAAAGGITFVEFVNWYSNANSPRALQQILLLAIAQASQN